MNQKIFWRIKDSGPRWHEGYVVKREGNKVKIGDHVNAYYGTWYDESALEIEKRD